MHYCLRTVAPSNPIRRGGKRLPRSPHFPVSGVLAVAEGLAASAQADPWSPKVLLASATRAGGQSIKTCAHLATTESPGLHRRGDYGRAASEFREGPISDTHADATYIREEPRTDVDLLRDFKPHLRHGLSIEPNSRLM